MMLRLMTIQIRKNVAKYIKISHKINEIFIKI